MIWRVNRCPRVRLRNSRPCHLRYRPVTGVHWFRARLSRQNCLAATFRKHYRLGPLGRDTDDIGGGGRRRAVR